MGISLKRSCITGESEIAYLCCISLKHIYMGERVEKVHGRLLGVVLAESDLKRQYQFQDAVQALKTTNPIDRRVRLTRITNYLT